VSITNVPLICWFDGTLTTDKDNSPKYVNGVVKYVMVRKSITRRELVEKIHRIIKIYLNEYLIQLICNWPVTQWYLEIVGISYDGDTRAMIDCTRMW